MHNLRGLGLTNNPGVPWVFRVGKEIGIGLEFLRGYHIVRAAKEVIRE